MWSSLLGGPLRVLLGYSGDSEDRVCRVPWAEIDI